MVGIEGLGGIGAHFLKPLLGGALIGIAVTIMLLVNGRVTGISGIINGLWNSNRDEQLWRFLFLTGLLLGGVLLHKVQGLHLDLAQEAQVTSHHSLSTNTWLLFQQRAKFGDENVQAASSLPSSHFAEALRFFIQNNLYLIVAGFLVGFGSVMGNGCTSGHGVCGISRFSMRSLVATLTFMLSGMLIVTVVRLLVEHL